MQITIWVLTEGATFWKTSNVGVGDSACLADFTGARSFARACAVALVCCLTCPACPLTLARAAPPAGPACCGPAGSPPQLASSAARPAPRPFMGCASPGGMLCASCCKGCGKLGGNAAAPSCCSAGTGCSRSERDGGAGSCVADCSMLCWACGLLTCPLPAGSAPPSCSFPGNAAYNSHVRHLSKYTRLA